MAGEVSGAPGGNYPNRSDLAMGGRVPNQVATGQQYGQAKAQREAQQAVPMGTPEVPFGRPSERPDEPITAGMDGGPGPGPEVLTAAMRGKQDDVLRILRGAYQMYPSDDLMDLIISESMR